MFLRVILYLTIITICISCINGSPHRSSGKHDGPQHRSCKKESHTHDDATHKDHTKEDLTSEELTSEDLTGEEHKEDHGDEVSVKRNVRDHHK